MPVVPPSKQILALAIQLLTGFLLMWPVELSAQEPSPLPQPAKPSQSQRASELDEFLTGLAMQQLPVPYTEDKDWGKTDERWDGIRLYRNSEGRLDSKRRKKTVNHGTWKKYTADLIHPAKHFKVNVLNFRENEDGSSLFTVQVAAKVSVHARQAKWVKGVQLYSVSLDAKADLKVAVDIKLATQLVPTKFPPDLIFKPTAESAELTVKNFRIDRVSKVSGEVAQQLTRAAEGKIESEVEKYEKKIVDKLNKSFEKEKDKLKLSLADALQSRWAALIGKEKKEPKENKQPKKKKEPKKASSK